MAEAKRRKNTFFAWISSGERNRGQLLGRYYGEDYRLFGELKAAGCSFVLRLRQEACWEVIEEYPLTPWDRAAGVRSDALVRLGAKSKSVPLRLVRVAGPREEILLVSDLGPEELAAELVGQVYRARWRIELFFKWIKCTLGCGHWLAESERGVALQIYCALIAALLLLAHSGRRPGKRAMEMIRFYLLGTATLEELCTQLGLKKSGRKTRMAFSALAPSAGRGLPKLL